VLEKLPFFALAAASCAVTLKVQRGAMIWMAKVPFLDRLGNALVSYWRYLGKLCWPAKLSVIYPVVDWPAQLVVLALLALLAVCVLAMVRWRPAPYFFTGWFWFIGTLIPVIGLVTVGEQSMADRYSYVPSIGVLIVLAWGAHDLSRHWHWQTAIFGTATIGVALACILITRQNIGYWKDTETLFRHATQSTDKNYRAFVNCGAALFNQGRVDEALRCFQEAVKSRPDSAEAHADLGVAWHAKNRPAEAIKEYQDAIRLRPGYAAAHVNLGIVLEENGQLDQAIQEFQQAIGLEPQALFYQRLGKVLSRRGRVEEAITQLQQAVGLDPGNASIHDALGDVFRSNGRAQEAASQFQEALRLDPHDAAARSNLDLLLNAKNR
jgi:Flp pilus assembly protein TadD